MWTKVHFRGISTSPPTPFARSTDGTRLSTLWNKLFNYSELEQTCMSLSMKLVRSKFSISICMNLMFKLTDSMFNNFRLFRFDLSIRNRNLTSVPNARLHLLSKMGWRNMFRLFTTRKDHIHAHFATCNLKQKPILTNTVSLCTCLVLHKIRLL